MCICLCGHVLSALKWVDDSFQTLVVGKVVLFMYVCMYDPLETKRKEGKSSERVGCLDIWSLMLYMWVVH